MVNHGPQSGHIYRDMKHGRPWIIHGHFVVNHVFKTWSTLFKTWSTMFWPHSFHRGQVYMIGNVYFKAIITRHKPTRCRAIPGQSIHGFVHILSIECTGLIKQGTKLLQQWRVIIARVVFLIIVIFLVSLSSLTKQELDYKMWPINSYTSFTQRSRADYSVMNETAGTKSMSCTL